MHLMLNYNYTNTKYNYQNKKWHRAEWNELVWEIFNMSDRIAFHKKGLLAKKCNISLLMMKLVECCMVERTALK